MKKRLLSALLAICLALALPPAHALAAETLEAQLSTGGQDANSPDKISGGLIHDSTMSLQDWQVLRLVNQHRMAMGLQPLSVFDNLQQTANQRAQELLTSYTHDRPDGSSFETAYAGYQVTGTVTAENISAGHQTSTSVMDSWLGQTEPLANIENPAMTHLGVGYRAGTHPTYWAQNFLGSSACRFSNISLSPQTIAGKPGADLETLLSGAQVTVTLFCSVHGLCRMPLIAAMCGGYQPGASGEQVLTVSHSGETVQLTVSGSGHTHAWGSGSVTKAATCTGSGVRSYLCAGCGESRTEVIPAAGHRFAAADSGDFQCGSCGVAIPASLKNAYAEAAALRDKTLPASVSQAVDAVRDYADSQVRAALRKAGSFRYTISDISYTAPADGQDGRYVYRAAISASTGTDTVEVTTEPLSLILPANAEDGATMYDISIPRAGGGETAASTLHAAEGEHITLTVSPGKGYSLKALTVSDSRERRVALHSLGGGRYSFTMPASQVTVNAVFQQAAGQPENDSRSMPFTDVRSGNWFYESVEYVWKNALMSGVSDTRFSPGGTCSRAMIWTVLARMNGVSVESSPGRTWYEPAMEWAVEQGVSDGSNPSGAITREQFAVMLWRNAGSPGSNTALTRFTDSGSVGGYALEAVQWAVSQGILAGNNGRLNPKAAATRAEAAAMLARS